MIANYLIFFVFLPKNIAHTRLGIVFAYSLRRAWEKRQAKDWFHYGYSIFNWISWCHWYDPRRYDFRWWHSAIHRRSVYLDCFWRHFFCGDVHMPFTCISWQLWCHGQSLLPPVKKMDELVERMSELASIARKDGMMALEGQDVPDKFFQKGLQMLVDGADEAKLVAQLNQEIKAMKLRHEANQGVVKGWIDIGPAMGMIGTLIGLVLMLGNMADPKAIGPAMAVALLTTMYGAIIANIIFMPMLVKLEGYTVYEVSYRELVVIGLRNIARGESPRNIQDQMVANLPPKIQAKLEAA